MYSRTVGLRTAAVVFGLVCLAQLFRLLAGVEVIVAGHVFPLWPSAIAFLVAGCLAVWMWMIASHHKPLMH
jgi:hypothetical protein